LGTPIKTNYFFERGRQKLPPKNMKTSGGDFSMNFRGANSQHEEARKMPTSKTQQVFHTRSVFYELELVMRMNTSAKTSHG
jgi:hypothetical protein